MSTGKHRVDPMKDKGPLPHTFAQQLEYLERKTREAHNAGDLNTTRMLLSIAESVKAAQGERFNHHTRLQDV